MWSRALVTEADWGVLTLPRLSGAVRRRPTARVHGLCLFAGVALERRESERLQSTSQSAPVHRADAAAAVLALCPVWHLDRGSEAIGTIFWNLEALARRVTLMAV
jgi:hypothetical protein